VKRSDCLLGSDRYRLDDNIKLDIKATRYKGVGWIRPAQDRVHLWTVLNPIMNEINAQLSISLYKLYIYDIVIVVSIHVDKILLKMVVSDRNM
jgi:hypothetical protein